MIHLTYLIQIYENQKYKVISFEMPKIKCKYRTPCIIFGSTNSDYL